MGTGLKQCPVPMAENKQSTKERKSIEENIENRYKCNSAYPHAVRGRLVRGETGHRAESAIWRAGELRLKVKVVVITWLLLLC